MTEVDLLGGVSGVLFERQAEEIRNDVVSMFQARRDRNMAREVSKILAYALMEEAAAEHFQARSLETQYELGEEAGSWLIAYGDALHNDWEEMKIMFSSTARELIIEAEDQGDQIDVETELIAAAYYNLSDSL